MSRQALNRAPSRHRPPRRRGRHGFTLVEVLAALLLMAITLPVIMQGVSISTSAASAARRRTEAGALADSKLAELVSTGQWQAGAASGDFGTDWPDYRWDADVQEWDQPDVRQLFVRVTWTGRSGEEAVTLTTLVYNNGSTGLQLGFAGGGAP